MKYSIRDLFLIIFIVALAAGWWVDRSRLASRDAEWEMQVADARRLSKESNVERTFDTPGALWSVNRRPDPERKPLARQVIHVGDGHYLPMDVFGADHSGDELDRHYAQHLADVEAVQAEQIEHLRALIRQHGLKRIWIEGLTPDDLPVFRTLVSVVKDSDAGQRELLLRIGAPGQLLASGELAEVLPLDEESMHRAANPVKEGHVVMSVADNAARERMMSQRVD